MRKHVFLLFLGISVFVVPFLGIPEIWSARILFVLGALIIVMGLMFRFSARKRERKNSEIYYEENEPLDNHDDTEEVQ